MKYGNFVGKGWLNFTSAEKKDLVNHFSKQIEENFGKDLFKAPSIECSGKEGEVIYLVIRFQLKKPFNGRNVYKETIKDFSSINFFVTKSGGYLECKDEDGNRYEDYDNSPDFSYGCNLFVIGKSRAYRCRRWENIQRWSPYTYGTEITDLTYNNNDWRGLKNTLTSFN